MATETQALPNIEYNPNMPWEQVLYFLKKKDQKIETLKDTFWNEVTVLLEKSFLSNPYIDELEIPVKKNKDNTTYDVIKLMKVKEQVGVRQIEKEVDGQIETEDVPEYETFVYWYIDNEQVDVTYLNDYFTVDRIIAFENNIIEKFEELHNQRNQTIKEFSEAQDYVKQELNTKPCNHRII